MLTVYRIKKQYHRLQKVENPIDTTQNIYF